MLPKLPPLRTLLILVSLGLAAPAAWGLEVFPTDTVTIATADGEEHVFTVEVATTPAQLSQGLMFREQLAPNAGMLFLYPDDKPRTFWMKNTPLPLDIIFIGNDGRVVHVAAEAQPFDQSVIPSEEPAAAALEIGGGLAAQLGIAPGATVSWPVQATAPR